MPKIGIFTSKKSLCSMQNNQHGDSSMSDNIILNGLQNSKKKHMKVTKSLLGKVILRKLACKIK